jgi:nucleoside-diphosphate-sugar epimerase
MRIGLLGLGNLGYPIANYLSQNGYRVFSWTRSSRPTEWDNAQDLTILKKLDLDSLIIASGTIRPGRGDFISEKDSTINLAKNLSTSSKTRVIYLSSGAVYGECVSPQSESVLPKPSTLYGQVKFQIENEFEKYFENRFCALRIGNVLDLVKPFGLAKVIKESFLSKRIEMFGLPTDCRDFITMHDFLVVIESLINNRDLPRVLNVGTGESIQLADIALLIEKYSKNPLEIIWSPRRLGDLGETRLDISAQKILVKKSVTHPTIVFRDLIQSCND